MAEKTVEVCGEDLEVQGPQGAQFVMVGNTRIRLANPMDLPFQWVGADDVMSQLRACWYIGEEGEHAMSPRLIGKPGVGKTVMAYSAAKTMDRPVYLFQATSDTQPNDVLINTVFVETGKDQFRMEYVASSLVTAMIVGGCIVFDEGNRMQEKAWASLSCLLDSRRYIESMNAGVVIKAHKEFRFVATMNDDASCFDLPEYIQSRLQPQIMVDYPGRNEERRILEVNCPNTDPSILDYISEFLVAAHRADERFTVREGIHLANYASKLIRYNRDRGVDIDLAKAVLQSIEQILGIRQTRYLKQILWREEEAA